MKSQVKKSLPKIPAPGAPKDFVPAYLETYRKGLLHKKVEQGLKMLHSCRVCPRNCEVNRINDETAICHTGRYAMVSSWGPHFGEEDCLRGSGGSGTIFFSHCNLKCVFCQNWDISQRKSGEEMTGEEIARLMIKLQKEGCHNINFVTPEHVVPQVLEAILVAVENGLTLPIVYNTGGYDSLDSLSLLEGVIDIYMPDFKFWSPQNSHRYVKAKDYPEVARKAIREMHRQVGKLDIDREGLARSGVLVRHLVMPRLTEESREIFRFLAKELSPETYVNIMDQYHPAHLSYQYPEIDRPLAPEELHWAYEAAQEEGLHRFDKRRTFIV